MLGIVALAEAHALRSVAAASKKKPDGNEAPPAPKPLPAWYLRFKREGFGFRHTAAFTFVVGIYLHVTALLIGRDLFQQYILTPRFDMLFAIPMTYAAASGLAIWKRVVHRSLGHKLVYTFLLVYLGISIPIHVQTFLTHSTDYIRAFPEWYGFFILPVIAALLAFVWRLEIKAE